MQALESGLQKHWWINCLHQNNNWIIAPFNSKGEIVEWEGYKINIRRLRNPGRYFALWSRKGRCIDNGAYHFWKQGIAQTAKPIFVLRGNAPMSIKDYLQSTAFTCDLLYRSIYRYIWTQVARDKRQVSPSCTGSSYRCALQRLHRFGRPNFSGINLYWLGIHSNDGRLVDGLVGALQMKTWYGNGIVGSGNMAYRLVPALQHVGLRVGQIWNRSQNNDLAAKYQLKMCTSAGRYGSQYVCLFAYQMMQLLKEREKKKKLQGTVVHTSGSVSSAVLNSFKHYGVMWYGANHDPTGKDKFWENSFMHYYLWCRYAGIFGSSCWPFSDRVYPMNDEQRLRVHLTAVMTNNFMNHLAILSRDYLQNNNLDYEIIVPS